MATFTHTAPIYSHEGWVIRVFVPRSQRWLYSGMRPLPLEEAIAELCRRHDGTSKQVELWHTRTHETLPGDLFK